MTEIAFISGHPMEARRFASTSWMPRRVPHVATAMGTPTTNALPSKVLPWEAWTNTRPRKSAWQRRPSPKNCSRENKFTVVTSGERVYNSRRKYAFVIVDWQGQPRYLHELLVAYGLGRIHTKPMTLPDNTAGSRQKKHLYDLRQFAQENRFGAWGVSQH